MNESPNVSPTEAQTLSEKRFFITGGSRGIGAAIAQLLAERGAQVAITYAQSKTAAEALIAKLPGSGHFSLQLELTDEKSINAAVDEVEAKVNARSPLTVITETALSFVKFTM